MKYSAVLLAAVFAAGASAQVTRADFPACALTCLQEAIASETDCAVDDTACSCDPANNELITAAATPCVLSSCQGPDITKTLEVSGQICAPGNNAGGAPADDAESATTVAVETTAVETTVEQTTVAATTTAAPVEDDDAETMPAGAASTVCVTACESASVSKAPVVPAPTGNTTSPVSPPSFTGAAGKVGATFGSVAAFAVMALAL